MATNTKLKVPVLNPLAVEVLKEEGIDISGYQPRAVFDVIKEGHLFANVITVCDETNAERCPTFPGVTERLHWSFPDPSSLEGTWEEKVAATRIIRDTIKARIISEFCAERCAVAA